jgi:D-alanyl-D-alanine carboxypeptidase (penicillin-binding protein 5/6)
MISVVLGIEGSAKEGFQRREQANLALLNWGFRHFETHTLYAAEAAIASPAIWKSELRELPVGLAEALVATIPRGRYADLKASLDVPQPLVAPYAKGQALGTLRLTLDGEDVAERPLIALSDAPESGFFSRSWDGLMMWWESD